MRHASAIDIVRQVIDNLEASAHRVAIHAGQIIKIDIVNRQRVTIAINEVNHRPANAANGGQAQLHWARTCLNGFRAAGNRFVISDPRIFHAKRHATGGRTMLRGKIGRRAFGFIIGNQVDFTLTP